ncbi:ADM_collapsed_G0044430.mRNA.1.CDS.1 [Saccharomyces cerevisiae]|nr:ADM_collapsed_G0044430.mRNA.1.CDS.1 [Saccharomyces cerevisiae]
MVMDMVRKNNSQALSTSQKFDLRRTPRQIGYILCTASHRLLSIEVIKYLRRRKGRRTFRPKLYEHPLYIPCAEPGKDIPALEIAKEQPGKCIVHFQVTDLAVIESAHHNRRKPLEVYFKATPEPNRYTFTLFPEYIVTGHFYKRDRIEDLEVVTERLMNCKEDIHWVPLDNTIPIKAFFGQFAKLAAIPCSNA